MKKVLMIAAVAVALSTTVMAQENNNRGEQRMDRTEMLQRRTDMMAQRYGLDDKQKAQLLELNTKYSDMMPMRRGGGPGHRQGPPQGGNRPDAQQGQNNNAQPEARQGQGRGRGFGGPRIDPEKMKEYEAGLKEIMTPEQFEKYEADKKNRPQRPQRQQND